MLYDWRAALVSLVSVPVSLTVAALVLISTGATVNVLLVAGFVVAIGVVVDDGVSTATAMQRRLAATAETGEVGRREALAAAVLEVRGPKLYATIILGLAVIPLLLLDGVSGALVPTTLAAFGAALVSSTIVAMTVTPALMALLMPPSTSRASRDPAGRGRAGGIRRLLVRLLDHQRPISAVVGVATVGVIAAVALSMAPGLAALEAPSFRERDLLVQFNGQAGTSHPAMRRIVSQGAGELQRIPGIRNVGAHVGRAIVVRRGLERELSARSGSASTPRPTTTPRSPRPSR